MRIWQLIDARSVGGIERHVATLTTALRRRGMDARIVLLKCYKPSPWRTQLELETIPHVALDGRIATLIAALRRDRPGLVHTHGYKANILGRLIARVLGVPVVSSFHAGEQPAFPVSLYTRLDSVSSILAPRIAVSEAIARSLPQPVHVVRNFVAVPVEPPTGPLPQRVGFIGRLSHEKGPDLFCELARRSRPGIEWHMWGDGPLRAGLEGRYGSDVTFHGLSLDIGKALASIGLLCMPSRAEGLPMAALEALAAGVPVLAARVGGLPSIIRDEQTGWLFDAEDIVSASALLEAWYSLAPASIDALRLACHRSVLESFSEQAVLPEILEIYAQAGLAHGRTTTTDQSCTPSGARAAKRLSNS
jgi:glycosyltransferase involved in cell wall biosynthesis